MARTQTIVQFSSSLLEALDDEAKHQSCSRSALIREAVKDYLNRSSVKAKERAWLAGYTSTPSQDQWGSLEQDAAATSETTATRLEDEEKETW